MEVLTGEVPTGEPTTRSRRRRVPAWAVLLLVVVLVRLLVAEPERVDGDSMAPTLRGGDVVLSVRPGLLGAVDRLDRGALVVLADPQGGGPIVKRVVGLPGDVVEIQDAVLSVDGRPVAEPHVDRSRIDGVYYGPVTVPAGSVLVLGDNRGTSVDSRDFGPVPVGSLSGRVLLRLWPWRR